MDITPSSPWADRIEIKSESSSRLYIVARCVSGKNAETWACSCPGFKAHKKVDPFNGRVTCKHLTKMGLPGPFPATEPSAPASRAETRHSFSDRAYAHYDPAAEGFGSADDWFRRAEEAAYGRGRYRGQAGERTDTGTGGRRRQQEQNAGGQRQRPGAGGRWEEPRRRPTYSAGPKAADMLLLDLTEMPPDVGDLKRAMRKRANVVHPDHEGGSREAFIEMYAAYERLLKFY